MSKRQIGNIRSAANALAVGRLINGRENVIGHGKGNLHVFANGAYSLHHHNRPLSKLSHFKIADSSN